MAAKTERKRRTFGKVRKLPSGRFQAQYAHPDDPSRYIAARHTFDTEGDADTWLATVRTDIVRGLWKPPIVAKPVTFAEHAERFMASRKLKPRTRQQYLSDLRSKLLPTFGALPLASITAELVEDWYYGLDPTKPTARSHAYGLLRTILGDATQRRLISHNACHIRGAGNVKRASKTKPATLEELETIVDAMPERLRLMMLLAAWCALRFGELTELRRRDVDASNGVIHVRRGVVRVNPDDMPDQLPSDTTPCDCRPGCLIGPPKSDAGARDVAIPPHLLPLVKAHVRTDISGGRDGLLFPAADGGHLAPSALYGRVATRDKRGKVTRRGWGYYEARRLAGRDDLRFHDLRHTGAVLAASTGATLAELMNRLGHSTPGAALRYQHAADGRDAEIAKALSALIERR